MFTHCDNTKCKINRIASINKQIICTRYWNGWSQVEGTVRIVAILLLVGRLRHIGWDLVLHSWLANAPYRWNYFRTSFPGAYLVCKQSASSGPSIWLHNYSIAQLSNQWPVHLVWQFSSRNSATSLFIYWTSRRHHENNSVFQWSFI